MNNIEVIEIPNFDPLMDVSLTTTPIPVVEILALELCSSSLDTPVASTIIPSADPPTPSEVVAEFLKIFGSEDYDKLISEVIIRFNTDPKYYLKIDFAKLISALLALKAYVDKNIKVLSDWAQTDSSEIDYIKNKPTSLSLFTDDLGDSPVHTHSQYVLKTDLNWKTF